MKFISLVNKLENAESFNLRFRGKKDYNYLDFGYDSYKTLAQKPSSKFSLKNVYFYIYNSRSTKVKVFKAQKLFLESEMKFVKIVKGYIIMFSK